MAIEDLQLMLSNDQAVTATAASTNYIDLGAARNIGIGEDMYVVFTVTTTTQSGGSTTLDLVLQGDSSSAFGSAATVQTLLSATAKATLVAGYQRVFRLQVFSTAYRYIRGYYTVNTSDFTAGAFRLSIQRDAQIYKAPTSPYPV